jgi:hypothetical protein
VLRSTAGTTAQRGSCAAGPLAAAVCGYLALPRMLPGTLVTDGRRIVAIDMTASPITIDTTSALETVLAFLGPPIGVVIGAYATRRAARAGAEKADHRARQAELHRALAGYIAATELVAVELASLPPASWLERQVDRIPRRRIGFSREFAPCAAGVWPPA